MQTLKIETLCPAESLKGRETEQSEVNAVDDLSDEI